MATIPTTTMMIMMTTTTTTMTRTQQRLEVVSCTKSLLQVSYKINHKTCTKKYGAETAAVRNDCKAMLIWQMCSKVQMFRNENNVSENSNIMK
jgi:hypothetical protein